MLYGMEAVAEMKRQESKLEVAEMYNENVRKQHGYKIQNEEGWVWMNMVEN